MIGKINQSTFLSRKICNIKVIEYSAEKICSNSHLKVCSSNYNRKDIMKNKTDNNLITISITSKNNIKDLKVLINIFSINSIMIRIQSLWMEPYQVMQGNNQSYQIKVCHKVKLSLSEFQNLYPIRLKMK